MIKVSPHMVFHGTWWLFERTLGLATGEFLLRWRPNSGGMVLVRAVLTTGVLFLFTVGLLEVLEPGPVGAFSLGKLATHVHDHITWLGAMFAGSYAAYYTRFSAQWVYLAGVYNMFMATRAKTTDKDYAETKTVFDIWRAGFIEDAVEMHLALKPTFSGVILSMMGKPGVKELYKNNSVAAQDELEALRLKLIRHMSRSKTNAVDSNAGNVTALDDPSLGQPMAVALADVSKAAQGIVTSTTEILKNTEQKLQQALDDIKRISKA